MKTEGGRRGGWEGGGLYGAIGIVVYCASWPCGLLVVTTFFGGAPSLSCCTLPFSFVFSLLVVVS